MKFQTLFVPAILIVSILSCRPKPIDIDVPQGPPRLVISSASLDDHSAVVSAGYSISSLSSLADSARGKNIASLPKDMLVDSGLVTITANGHTDTLQKISSGLFGSYSLHLQASVSYTLRVLDYRKNTEVVAVTYYYSKPVFDTIQPIVVRTATDTSVKLKVSTKGINAGDHYFISYATTRNVRDITKPISYKNISSLASFVPKQLILFTGEDVAVGTPDKSFTLNVHGNDTLLVHIGHIDEAYYNYLTAYKRSGYLINQLTGEPINLPTNIVTGFGFFSLYTPTRLLLDLNKY